MDFKSDKAKEYSKLTSLSSKDTELLEALFCNNKEEKRVTPSVCKFEEQFKSFMKGDNTKALIISTNSGDWYIHAVFIRFYIDTKTGDTKSCQSYLQDASRRSVMENGSIITVEYADDGVCLMINGIMGLKYDKKQCQWIKPLTAEQLKNYNIQ